MSMNKMLLILVITILLFVIAVFTYNFLDKQVQPELINMFLAACIAELTTMGGIKAFKIKHKEDK